MRLPLLVTGAIIVHVDRKGALTAGAGDRVETWYFRDGERTRVVVMDDHAKNATTLAELVEEEIEKLHSDA